MTGSKKNLPKYSDLIGKQNLLSKDDPLPVKRQCELLSLNRTSVYYKPQEPTAQQIEREELIKSRLDYWHTQQCCLGVRGLRTKLRKEDKRVRTANMEAIFRVRHILLSKQPDYQAVTKILVLE
jgi:hypothetical protein